MSFQTLTAVEIAKLPADLRAKVEAMQSQATALVEASKGKFSMHIGQKGGLSLSGFGRYPVTLYAEQWVAFLNYLEDGGIAKIRKFMEANKGELKTKAQAAAVEEKAATNGKGDSK